MANFSLQHVTRGLDVPHSDESEAAHVLRRLWSHPIVTKFAEVFNERLLSRIAEHYREPNAVDWDAQGGDFVLEGLRPMLLSALREQRLSLESMCGAILLDDRFAIAAIHVPRASPYGTAAQRDLFNRNVLFTGERFVATPYRALEGYISPMLVRGDAPAPAFELADGEALAVEAGLVLRSAAATHGNAIATREEGRVDAFSLNVRGMVEIIDYIKDLLVRLDAFASSGPHIASVPHMPAKLLADDRERASMDV